MRVHIQQHVVRSWGEHQPYTSIYFQMTRDWRGEADHHITYNGGSIGDLSQGSCQPMFKTSCFQQTLLLRICPKIRINLWYWDRWPFLAMGWALIDVQNGDLTFRVNNEELKISNIWSMRKSNDGGDECFVVEARIPLKIWVSSRGVTSHKFKIHHRKRCRWAKM